MKKLVITQHKGLVEFLIEKGIVEEGCEVIAHATKEDVKDRHVVGVLPLNLAAHAASVTSVAMNIPLELRGKDLSLEQMREYAGEVTTYEVRIIE